MRIFSLAQNSGSMSKYTVKTSPDLDISLVGHTRIWNAFNIIADKNITNEKGSRYGSVFAGEFLLGKSQYPRPTLEDPRWSWASMMEPRKRERPLVLFFDC